MTDYRKHFAEHIKEFTDQELIDSFNNQVGNRGWGRAKNGYLLALKDEMEERNIDISIVYHNKYLDVSQKVELVNGVLVFTGEKSDFPYSIHEVM